MCFVLEEVQINIISLKLDVFDKLNQIVSLFKVGVPHLNSSLCLGSGVAVTVVKRNFEKGTPISFNESLAVMLVSTIRTCVYFRVTDMDEEKR